MGDPEFFSRGPTSPPVWVGPSPLFLGPPYLPPPPPQGVFSPCFRRAHSTGSGPTHRVIQVSPRAPYIPPAKFQAPHIPGPVRAGLPTCPANFSRCTSPQNPHTVISPHNSESGLKCPQNPGALNFKRVGPIPTPVEIPLACPNLKPYPSRSPIILGLFSDCPPTTCPALTGQMG